MPSEAGMKVRTRPKEPNYVRLVWSVRRVTDTQAKYVRLFYGEAVLESIRGGPPVPKRSPRGNRGAVIS
jgi:hypothetical protein